MDNLTVTKNDFIKFNVSPQFKSIVSAKAKQRGLTLSELGRLLFGAFANDLFSPNHTINLVSMAKTAEDNFTNGKGQTFSNPDDAIKYLENMK